MRKVGIPVYVKTGVHGQCTRRTRYTGVRTTIRATKLGNASRAKGCREMDMGVKIHGN